MPDLSRILESGRLVLALLLLVPIGMLLAPGADGFETHYVSGARAAEWNVQTGTQVPQTQSATTHADILARFADAEGALSNAEIAQIGLVTDNIEGEVVTTDLPASYVAGGAPDSDLAAVLRESQQRNAAAAAPPPPTTTDLIGSLAQNPRVVYTRQSQIDDILGGTVDPRVIDLLTWITTRRASITITSVRTDHTRCVAGSSPCRVSAHHLGRAVDIAAVNGEACVGTPTGQCGQLYEELVTLLRGTIYQPSQIIYGYDPWPSEPWNFAMSNHRDHIHIGY